MTVYNVLRRIIQSVTAGVRYDEDNVVYLHDEDSEMRLAPPLDSHFHLAPLSDISPPSESPGRPPVSTLTTLGITQSLFSPPSEELESPLRFPPSVSAERRFPPHPMSPSFAKPPNYLGRAPIFIFTSFEYP